MENGSTRPGSSGKSFVSKYFTIKSSNATPSSHTPIRPIALNITVTPPKSRKIPTVQEDMAPKISTNPISITSPTTGDAMTYAQGLSRSADESALRPKSIKSTLNTIKYQTLKKLTMTKSDPEFSNEIVISKARSNSSAVPPPTQPFDPLEEVIVRVSVPTKDSTKTLRIHKQNKSEEILEKIIHKFNISPAEVKLNQYWLYLPSINNWAPLNKTLFQENDNCQNEEIVLKPRRQASVLFTLSNGNRPQRCLFDYVAILQLKQVNSEKGEHRNEIEFEYTYPEPASMSRTRKKEPLLVSLPLFCFPDSESFHERHQSEREKQHFSFTLTTAEGDRRLGYCLRYPRSSVTQCFCILSPLQCTSLFRSILDTIVLRYDSSREALTEFLVAMSSQAFPLLGETIGVIVPNPFRSNGEDEKLEYHYGHDSTQDVTEIAQLLSQLCPDNLLLVFTSLLVERRIIFYSSNVSILSSCVQAAVSLLFPLRWQHIYVPVLPPDMLNYVCAPMPFVIGVLKSSMDRVNRMPMDEVLIVDLDEDKLFHEGGNHQEGQDYHILPAYIGFALTKPLKALRQKAMKIIDLQRSCEKLAKEQKNLTDVFGSFFVAALAFYRNHVDDKGMFDKEGFVNQRIEEMRPFFSLFVMSQLFERFIEEGNFRDLKTHEFEKRLKIYEDDHRRQNTSLRRSVCNVFKHDWNFLLP
eukprot:TRINITY_DN189_c0_g1_i1.p1 TRINITY_DN189_c0_g1~~TRINITY_DN189_c0_g1_i1.p1  ORF type:complete len:694 (+),score=98.54 TRINITY_DN189_c0_g1_i1:49-2130(+)